VHSVNAPTMLLNIAPIVIGILDYSIVIIPGYVSPEMRGTAFGLYYIVIGSGFFICNMLFGFLWDAFSFNAAAVYSLILSLGAIFGLLLFSKRFVATTKIL
jgi:MFS family permease